MEIVLNCGDKINIPDGCKAEIKDGVITIEKPRFKDGDILADVTTAVLTCPFIARGECEGGCYGYYVGVDKGGDLSFSTENWYWTCGEVRLATEEEKQLLFGKLEEQGLRWNAEEKKLEITRWRANKGGLYYFLITSPSNAHAEDDGKYVATHRYAAYNYFRREIQAVKAVRLVKDTLKKFHEENSQDEKDNVQ